MSTHFLNIIFLIFSWIGWIGWIERVKAKVTAGYSVPTIVPTNPTKCHIPQDAASIASPATGATVVRSTTATNRRRRAAMANMLGIDQ